MPAHPPVSLFKTALERSAVGKLLVRPLRPWSASASPRAGVDKGAFPCQVLWANRALCTLLGYPRETFLTLGLAQLCHPQERLLLARRLAQLAAGEIATYQREHRFAHHRGDYVWGLLQISGLRDGRGEMRYLLAEIQDIGLAKAYRATRAVELERLKAAEILAHLGSWELDLDSGLSRWSAECGRILGLAAEEASTAEGMPFGLLPPEERHLAIFRLTEAVRLREDYLFTCRLVWPQGEVRHLRLHGRILEDQQGQPARVAGYILDITAHGLRQSLNRETRRLLELQKRQLRDLAREVSEQIYGPLSWLRRITEAPGSSESEA